MHCGIYFLTHPRNAKRDDLRCPFGCRDAHRKESLKRRSAEWYRSEKGKKKKKALNRRRSLKTLSENSTESLASEELSEQKVPIVQDESKGVFNTGTLSYLQMLISLIEGRLVSLDEITKMLLKKVRQHSIDRRRRFVYAFTYPGHKPP